MTTPDNRPQEERVTDTRAVDISVEPGRPVRQRRPPDRYGEWIMPFIVSVDERDVIYV